MGTNSDIEIVIPPVTEGFPESVQYRLYVNGHACPVYDTRVFFELNNQNRLVSFAQFDFYSTGAGGCRIFAPCDQRPYPPCIAHRTLPRQRQFNLFHLD